MKPGEFVTADHHWSHDKIRLHANRPFKNVHEMNNFLIEAWNTKVPEGAIVYHLGDFAFAKPESIINIRRRLNGTIRLIKGNHDKRNIKGDVLRCFEWVKDYYESKCEDGTKVVMSHYPFLTWNGSHRGAWCLAGHSHNDLPDDPRVRRLDVGVDTKPIGRIWRYPQLDRTAGGDYAPYSFEEIAKIMAGRGFGPNHPR